MYESERKGISWFGIFRKLLILILIMILIFGFIYFINARKQASKNDDVKIKETKTNNTKKGAESTSKNQKKQKSTKTTKKKETKKTSKSSKKKTSTLSTALVQFENGALKYFNPNNLPVEENKSKTIKLQNLINSGTLKALESKDGKTCDKNKSTTTITRLKNNYKLSTNLVCGTKSVKKTSYVGCYSNCLNNKICRGDSSEYAVCKTPKTTSSTTDNKTNTNTNTNNQNNTNNNSASTNNTTTNGATPSNNNQTTTPSTNNNSTSSSNNNQTTKTYYKYKRCRVVPVCHEGTLNKYNECVVTRVRNYTNSNGSNYQSTTNSYYAPSMETACETMWSDNPNLPGWEKTYITKHK